MEDIEKVKEISKRLIELAEGSLKGVDIGRYIKESNRLRKELKAVHQRLLKTPLID